MARIERLAAQEILHARGHSMLSVTVVLDDGSRGRAAGPLVAGGEMAAFDAERLEQYPIISLAGSPGDSRVEPREEG